MDLHDFNLSTRRWLCRLSSQIVLCIMATGLFMSHAQTSADTEPRSESITTTDSSRELEVLHAELAAKLARLQQEVAKKLELLATEDPVFAPRDDFESDKEYGQRCLRAAWNAHALRAEAEASTLKEINDLREREIDVEVEVTFDDYDANAQIYSITVTEPQSGTSRGVEVHVERDQARALYNHQDELISTAAGRLDAAGRLSLERVSLRLMSPEVRVEEPIHRLRAVIFPGDHMLLDLVLSEDGKLLVLAAAHLVGTRVVVNVIARSLVQNDEIWRWEPPEVMELHHFMALLSGSDRQYLDMIPDPTDRHLAVRVNGHLYSLDLRSGEILADTRISGGPLAFDPTGSHLVLVRGGAWESGSPRQPGRLYVLSTNDLQPILSYEAPWPDRQSKHDDLGTYQQPNALGFTPAGFLTVATNGGTMFFVDVETGAGLGKVEGPVVMRDPFFLNDSGLSQFVPGSKLFVASEAYPDRGNGFKTQVLDLSTGENRAETVRSSPASQVAFDPAGRFVAWVGEDSWEIIHADTGDTLFREQGKSVSMLDFGDGGRRLAVGYTRTAVIYRLPDLPPAPQPENQSDVVADVGGAGEVADPANECFRAVQRSDFDAAVAPCTTAAESGHSGAQLGLGLMYDFGEGVPEDNAKAVEWYTKAAEQGLAVAQHSLGNMYVHGEGVPMDYAIAVKWLTKAAEQGHAKGLNDLGLMYAMGRGVPQDYVRAYVLLNLAYKSGMEEAATPRDMAREQMTPEQVREAQRLLLVGVTGAGAVTEPAEEHEAK